MILYDVSGEAASRYTEHCVEIEIQGPFYMYNIFFGTYIKY